MKKAFFSLLALGLLAASFASHKAQANQPAPGPYGACYVYEPFVQRTVCYNNMTYYECHRQGGVWRENELCR